MSPDTRYLPDGDGTHHLSLAEHGQPPAALDDAPLAWLTFHKMSGVSSASKVARTSHCSWRSALGTHTVASMTRKIKVLSEG